MTQLSRVDMTLVRDADTANGRYGQARATVVTRTGGNDEIHLCEHGHFQPPGHERPLPFTHHYNWHQNGTTLSLYRARPVADTPLHLVDLEADGPATLVCASPHACGEDRYYARLELTAEGLALSWRTIGPYKAETLECRYQTA